MIERNAAGQMIAFWDGRRASRRRWSWNFAPRARLECLFLVAIFAIAQPASADEVTCGALKSEGQYGPFDYRVARKDQLSLVERFHFTSAVEQLKHGAQSGAIGGDIDYTLRAFPNHHRALVAMINLRFKERKDPPKGAQWPVECYFDRAFRFRSDDSAVHTIFGVYMMRLGKNADAIAQFEIAEKLGDDSGNVHYNAGLAYFTLGDYDKALMHAKKAYDRGFDLPGLRNKLKKAGKWPAD